MLKLTDRQLDYLNYIIWFIEENHNFPTHLQLADHFECAQNSSYGHIKALIDKGAVERVPQTFKYRLKHHTLTITKREEL